MVIVERRSDIFSVVVIILVALIRFAPFLLYGNPVNSDSWKNYYPWHVDYNQSEIKTVNLDADAEFSVWLPMAADDIKHGHFPHWNPYSYCGTPLYANHLVPVFHVPLLLAFLWPSEKVTTVYALIMAIIGPLFFYWFLRNWRLSSYVSLFGAIAFMLSGWMDLAYPLDVASFIYIPAILLFLDRFSERGLFLDAACGAFCLGQLLIVGYPVYVIHFAYFAHFYILWRRFHPAFARTISNRRWFLGVITLTIGGILISTVQNYPTYEFMNLSKRGLTSGKAALAYKIRDEGQSINDAAANDRDRSFKSAIINKLASKSYYIIPATMGNEGRKLLGPVVVFLALIGLICADSRFRMIKIVLLIFMILVLIPPIYFRLALYVPGWALSTRSPSPIFFFILIFTSALGLDVVLKREKGSRIWLLIGAFYLLLLFLLLRLHPMYLLHPSQVIYRWNVRTDILFIVLYVTISAIIVAYTAFRMAGWKSSTFQACLVLFIFIVLSLGSQFYAYHNFAGSDPLPFNSELAQIRNLVGDSRIARYDTSPQKFFENEPINFTLLPNLPGKFGMYDVMGYDSLILSDYCDFLEMLEPSAIVGGRGISHFQQVETFEKLGFLKNGAGMRYILTPPDLNDRNLEKEFGAPVYRGGVDIFKVKESSPPIFRLIPEFEVIKKGDAIPELHPFKAILEKEPSLLDGRKLTSETVTEAGLDAGFANFKPEILERSSTVLKLHFTAPSDCLLFISETWHPGWRCKLDGEEVEILKANLAFRAIAVPGGEHDLYMWYDGVEVLRGGLISVAAIFILTILAFIDLRINRKK